MDVTARLHDTDGMPREMTCGNVRYNPSGIQQSVDGWVRRIDFEPGYDCISDHPDPSANGWKCHGRHGMQIRFILGSEEGVVQFLLGAIDWVPGSLNSIGNTRDDVTKFGVMASDLGHHWTRPLYRGEPEGDSCEYLHGARCFYDGSGLNAIPILNRFLREGLDAVWQELEEYHRYCSEQAAKVQRGED